MGELYTQHKDEDGFIYVMYSGENTFGNTNENNAVEFFTTENNAIDFFTTGRNANRNNYNTIGKL